MSFFLLQKNRFLEWLTDCSDLLLQHFWSAKKQLIESQEGDRHRQSDNNLALLSDFLYIQIFIFCENMVYVTADEVRTSSWFDWNTDITDTVIDWHIEDAHNVLLWYIWSYYDITALSWSNFTWSAAAWLLKKIELLLASWYLLLEEYWPNQLWSDTDGEWKIEKAEQMIREIIGEWLKMRVRLIGNDWKEFAQIGLTSTRAPMRSTWLVWNTSKFSVNDSR